MLFDLVFFLANPKCPEGYKPGDFDIDGQVFASKLPGTIALQLWYNATINDHLTVAR